jgi:16S rRNA (adenine1518-N6/adenine1519-N6)-dimethyltransferase
VNYHVKPKKHLGQHFLKDESIAEKIANLLDDQELGNANLLEIGPGMGVLTQFLIHKPSKLSVIELDSESVIYLKKAYEGQSLKIIEADFLNEDVLNDILQNDSYLIGNFPYNISSQIIFKLIEHKDQVLGLAGMFQKEVAERLVAKKGSKTYGILSVLLNAYYDSEYCFTVEPGVFNPPPKVKSGVIKCIRKKDFSIPCNELLFKDVVKTAFNQRRKTLRNALHKFNIKETDEFAKLRAEQLSVDDFIKLTQFIENKQ